MNIVEALESRLLMTVAAAQPRSRLETTSAFFSDQALELRHFPLGTAVVVGGDAVLASDHSFNPTFYAYDEARGAWRTFRTRRADQPVAATVVSNKGVFLDVLGHTAEVFNAQSGALVQESVSVQPAFLRAAVSVGDMALFAGGVFNYSTTDVVVAYNATSDSWSNFGRLSSARSGISAAAVNGVALFAGGYASFSDSGAHDVSAAVDLFDSRTSNWSTASLSVPRFGMSAITVGGDAVFAGGLSTAENGVGSANSQVDIYHQATNTWSTAQLSAACDTPAAVTIGSEAFFCLGGGAASGPSAVVDTFDSVSDAWGSIDLPLALNGAVATALGHRLVVAGGYTINKHGQEVLNNEVFIYNTRTQRLRVSRAMYDGADTAVAVGRSVVLANEFGASDNQDAVDVLTERA